MKKSREEMNIWDRHDHDQNMIRKLLKGCKDPNKGLQSKEIMDELRISSSVFKTRIDPMIKSGEVECYPNPKNRRQIFYRLVDLERTKGELARHYSQKFIRSMKGVLHTEKFSRKYPATVTIFISPVSKKERAKAKGLIDGLAETNLQALDQTLELGIERLLKPEQKIAIIWTLEGKK